MEKIDIVLTNEEGLHARPASIFSKKAAQFNSKIILYKNGDKNKEYNPKSILSLMTMGAVKGDKITVVAVGEDEGEVVRVFSELLENGFDVENK